MSSAPATDDDLRLGVLGPFRARVDEVWQEAPTRQVARVATILAGWPGEPVERDRIVAGMWGSDTPATVTNTLQVHVSHLRRLIGKSTVRSQGTNYFLDLTPEAIDAEHMVECIHEAARMRRREYFGRASELLDTAVRLWRGMPFPDVSDADLEARRARLEELRDQAREDLLECRLELARDRFELADVVADAKELISRDPVRERGHVLLVRALAAADRPGEASAAYEAACRHMRTSQGLDPGRELTDMHARGLARDPDLLPKAMRSIRVFSNGDSDSDRRVSPEARLHLKATHSPEPSPNDTTASRVRECVVEIGARHITVRTGDATPDLLDSIAQHLADDLLTGVIVVNSGQEAKDVAWEAVRQHADTNISSWEDVDGLDSVALICDTSTNGDAALRRLTRHLGGLRHQPVLVNVGPEALGLPFEMVIDADAPSSAVNASAAQGEAS